MISEKMIMFSDIELMIEKGPLMALSFIPLFLGSFLWLAAGILAFSWLEGRWGSSRRGKPPGGAPDAGWSGGFVM